VNTSNAVHERALTAVSNLRLSGFQGKTALPGEAGYDRAWEIWNGAVEARPAPATSVRSAWRD
jgi:hypothetical protein